MIRSIALAALAAGVLCLPFELKARELPLPSPSLTLEVSPL